jgi:starch phosphorylase
LHLTRLEETGLFRDESHHAVPEPHANRVFSMEIAIHPEIPTCAGGLGVLAGDTAWSCADLELPVVFVSLVSRAGYFRQRFDPEGRQVEEPDTWDPASWCTPMDAMIAVRIEQRLVWIRPWLYVHSSDHGHMIPVLLLDTDLPQNAPEDRTITHFLYGGDETYRLKQEIVLGIGGLRLLRALGLTVETHHLNEGHAALLLLELLDRSATKGDGKPQYDTAYVRSCCVFTTHTPVESGRDRFSYELFQRLLPDFIPLDMLALNLAGFVNGASRDVMRKRPRIFFQATRSMPSQTAFIRRHGLTPPSRSCIPHTSRNGDTSRSNSCACSS